MKQEPALEPRDSGSSPRSEPLAPVRRKQTRRRSSRRAAEERRGRLRIIYFTLASVWGFMTGTAAILGSLVAIGRPLTLEPRVGTVLAISVVVAVLGGFVAARAYREIAGR